MKKGINYWAFPNDEKGRPPDLLLMLKKAKDLGYDCFEVTVEAKGLVSPAMTREDAIRVRKEADRIGIELITCASALAWAKSPSDKNPLVREEAIEQYRKIIQICSWLGIGIVLYLPGMVSAVFAPEFTPQLYEEVAQRAKEAIKALLPMAEKTKVKLAVENVWNRFLLSPVEMREFIDYFKSPNVVSYFDVGNVMLYGHPEDWIGVLERRIAAVHMKDFRVTVGNLDGFVDLLSGDVNFKNVMAAFRMVGYNGPFTVEIVPGKQGAAEKAIAALRIIETFFAA